MKIRKLLFGSAFILALACSFAFKSKTFGWQNATYWVGGQHYECASGVVDESCSIIGSGPQCETYDMVTQTYQPAYTPLSGGAPCTYPFYYPW